jgi:ribonuclease HI
VGHALWSCPAAQYVWHECSHRIKKTPLKHTRFLDIFEGLLKRFDEAEIDFFASVARQVWLRRHAHVLKCNWDAALDVGRKIMGIGLIIRDHEGAVVAAKCSTQSHVSDPLIAETIAVWKATRFIKHKGFGNVILEGDSLGVVNSLQDEEQSWAQAGHLIEDTKNTLSGLAWRIQHIGREANTAAADKPAKMALLLVEEHQWVFSIPHCIQNIVLAEKQLID